MSEQNIIEMNGIEKSFNSVSVLNQTHFYLRKGEVHALMGGNGAGKSTLMKILTGVYIKDAGIITIDGKIVELDKSRNAEGNEIAMIFQEFSLIPTLTVAENIFLNREPKYAKSLTINDKEMVIRAQNILNDLDVNIDPLATVDSLSVGQWQMVEIAKALSKDARILIMDEPTASLSESETHSLFQLVKRLKNSGISIIYISHRMEEIFKVCDRISIMRDGRNVKTGTCEELTMEEVVESMLGENTSTSFSWKERNYKIPDSPILEVNGVSVANRINNIDFQIYPGEIVGLAGLMGSGRTEIAESIFGIRKPDSGEVYVNGVKIEDTRDAIQQGVVLVPENRRSQGLILDHTISDNIIITNLFQLSKYFFVNDYQGTLITKDYIDKLNIKTDSPEKITGLLSGGNQQKVVLSKWLARNPQLLILDEPTIGVDIGAKSEILEVIRTLADKGIAVLVISSELPELLAISDRIIVLYNEKILKHMDRRDIESEEVLHHAIQGYL